MTLYNMNTKKDKQPLQDCDARIKEIRLQLNEQLKCIDQRADSRNALLTDVQDFLKRKSEIQSEYARKLDALSEKFLSKQRNLYSLKKEQTDVILQTPVRCWFQMLEMCQLESKDLSMMHSVYHSQMLPRLQAIAEDASRLHKKHREIMLKSHEDLLQDLKKLLQAMQLYQVHWNESSQAENKFRQIEKQFEKRNDKTVVSPQIDSKVKRSTSFRKLEKLKEKRLIKYAETKEKCVKARNEYILQLEATNATLNKYYGTDVSELLDFSNIGYHSSLERAWDTFCEAESAAQTSKLTGIAHLKQTVDLLDPDHDRRVFLENNHHAFVSPQLFVYTGQPDDNMGKVSLILPKIYKEYEKRCKEMERTLHQMNTDQEEQKKSLSASVVSMSQLASSIPSDVASSFLHATRNPEGPFSGLVSPVAAAAPVQPFTNKQVAAIRGRLYDIESYYVQKFEEYLQRSNMLNRLEARHKVLDKALQEEVPVADNSTFARLEPPNVAPKPGKKSLVRRARSKVKPSATNVNHFSKDLIKSLEESGRSIPLVVESCIRMINLYGLHHQGIFRVPGSHQEILELKAAFQKGEDPVSEKEDNTDVNTVSGLLKLYFRELDEKLFPQYIFDDLVKCAHIADIDERTTRIRQILLNIPESVLIVMRYLFAFLNHLSQNSDENMMDAYNIAVCFGPTLLPVPDTYDQVTTQANVNEIIKTIVMNHELIFPTDMDGPIYEKVMTSEEFTNTGNGADVTAEQADAAAQSSASDDDSEQFMEGLAKYDYKGRSERELSFVKGDVLTLYRQASDDWWEGSFKGREGLIPNAYIIVQDIVDGSPDVLSSRTESEVSLDSGGTPQSPSRKSIPNLQQPSNRRLSSESAKPTDHTKLPAKSKSLDRYNTVQDYLRQQQTIASIASKAAQQGLARSSDTSKTLRSSSLRQDKSSPMEEREDVFSGVDPASLSVAQRIAHFGKSTKGPGIDPDTLQKPARANPRIVVSTEEKKDIDETMKNALSELNALDMQGGPQKPAPDIVLDTLDNKSRQKKSSDSPTHSRTSSNSDGKRSDSGHRKPEQLRSTSGQSEPRKSFKGESEPRKSFKGSKNNNNSNNSTSHYQVPTQRHHNALPMPDINLNLSVATLQGGNPKIPRAADVQSTQPHFRQTARKTAF